jgi:hypothetical protein
LTIDIDIDIDIDIESGAEVIVRLSPEINWQQKC